MAIKDINKANRIKILITIFKTDIIEINKAKHKIYQNGVDCTDECKQIEDSYTIGDMVIGSPYKGGMVMSKILNNATDKRCMKFLEVCDDVILEN